MGSTFAPSIAGLYVHHLETERILCDINPFLSKIKLWKRYIDDILVIWQGTEHEALAFAGWLNDQDRFLNFTHTITKQKLTFLDLDILPSDTGLKTINHVKTTARNSLLCFDSFHPRHMRENLPFGQFLRLRRNCSEITDFKDQASNLTEKLRLRKYPEPVLKKALKRARNNHREALLEERPTTTMDPRLVCVTTYNCVSNKVSKIINQNWRILTSNSLSFPKPIFAHRRCRNLKDRLVHTRPRAIDEKRNAPVNSVRGHFACGNCNVCPFTTATKSIHFETGLRWEIRNHTNCNTQRVVYMILCPCGLRYIGMTSRKAKIRIGEHRSSIRCKKSNTKMTSHFLELGHSADDLSWVILESLPATDNCERVLLEKEQRWIFRLGSHVDGLNEGIPWGALTN